MMHKSQYKISDYSNWNDDIYMAIEDFVAKHNTAPHIILTSEQTQNMISIIMSGKKIVEGNITEYQEISEFECALARVQFCLDAGLEDREFVLVYDEGLGLCMKGVLREQ